MNFCFLEFGDVVLGKHVITLLDVFFETKKVATSDFQSFEKIIFYWKRFESVRDQ